MVPHTTISSPCFEGILGEIKKKQGGKGKQKGGVWERLLLAGLFVSAISSSFLR